MSFLRNLFKPKPPVLVLKTGPAALPERKTSHPNILRTPLELEEARREEANAPPAGRKGLTGGAKLIAFYVLTGSWAGFKQLDWSVFSLHNLRAEALILSGLIGSILLFRRKRAAKYFFTFWTLMLALDVSPFSSKLDGDPLLVRIMLTFLITIFLVIINREVDRNVIEDWERDEFED